MFALQQPEPSLPEKEIQGIHLADLTIIGNTLCTGIRYGADPAVPGSNPRFCVFERLRIENCATAVEIQDAEGGATRDCELVRNDVGIDVGGLAEGGLLA
jgi:hypothetical protein